MKSKSILVMMIAMITLSQSCVNTPIRGNKYIVTREINVNDYDEIQISVPVDFEYSQSASPYLQVTTDENILEYLKIYTEGRTLHIKSQKMNGNTYVNLQPTTLKITGHSSGLSEVKSSGSAVFQTMNALHVPSLEFALSGSGKILFNDSVTVNRLGINISGSGRLETTSPVIAEDMNVKISGSGKIVMPGKITNSTISISGSGNMNALDATFTNLSCHISGSGESSATILQSLSYSISGSGKISYRGNPALSGSVSGSGKIIHLD